jgi:glycerol-3-phosphate dehydrogenase subunit C
MMRFDPHDPKYWDKKELQTEFTRVVDICNGCRLCDNLCTPFVDLFDRIDAEDDKLTAKGIGHENPVMELTKTDYKNVVDYCYQCKLCYPKCPYTPPHEYQLDFPRLLLRAQAIEVKEHHKTFKESLRDNFLGDADRIGTLSEKMTGLMNWANNNPTARAMMETTIGIHRDKKLPVYQEETFRSWFDNHPMTKKPEPTDKVALFYTCMVNNNKPWIGKQFVEILENHNIQVLAPEQECCGMPELGTGELERVYAKVNRNVKRLSALVDAGYKIIAMSPSCSMMLREEYVLYASDKVGAQKIKENMADPCEYLMQLHRKKILKTDFPVQAAEKITYHVPCHLKVQNIGFQSRDLLKLLPNTQVQTVQQCSGHDGSFSMKKEYYQISLHEGRKLFKAIEKEKPAVVASDCSLAHLHIEEGTDEQALHPIEIVYQAMGLTQFLNK